MEQTDIVDFISALKTAIEVIKWMLPVFSGLIIMLGGIVIYHHKVIWSRQNKINENHDKFDEKLLNLSIDNKAEINLVKGKISA